ncbi:sigma-54-dependent Fis family transcriptional regulator [Candidatus Sumerlaeota bacterium]|nr:sigma-54-dependent Fis family transcriptional regulator [Candidatus Sumerlaeota bacterium]
MERILIVDDNKDMRFILSNVLKDEGFDVTAVGDGIRALKEVKENPPALVLLDMRLPGKDGITVLEEMKKIDKDLLVIMLTAYGDVKSAVQAMKLGAYDYITKPFDSEEIVLVIRKALHTRHLSKEVETLRKRLNEKTEVEELIGDSPEIKQVIKQVKIIAPTNMTIILEGESGTGKELIAQMIHQESHRKNKPFVAVNCGAIPETLIESELFGYEKGAFTGADTKKEGEFERANGGTLFLDEITNLSLPAQAKLLRVLENKCIQHLGGKKLIEVDVRIIAATNVNLNEEVRTGKFRHDLFYRLNEFYITLPALRERKDDIPLLAQYILDKANQEFNKKIKGFSPEVMRAFLNYSWPGNVRELKNVIRRAVLLTNSEYIKPCHLPPHIITSPESSGGLKSLEQRLSLNDITRRIERELIVKALAEAGGNKTKAAELLGIHRKALYRRLKSVGL